MTFDEAVWVDPERMSGVPCFRGTRIPVSTLFVHLEADELKEFYLDFPDVTPEMVQAVLDTSRTLIDQEARAKAA